MLEGYLDAYRALAVRKAAGLDAGRLATRLPPSTSTLGGLLKHLAVVEDDWFHSDLAGNDLPEPWASVDPAEIADWEWTSAADDSPEELLALFEAACARSRAAAAAVGSLEEMSVKTDADGRPWSLRWIDVHMTEAVLGRSRQRPARDPGHQPLRGVTPRRLRARGRCPGRPLRATDGFDPRCHDGGGLASTQKIVPQAAPIARMVKPRR